MPIREKWWREQLPGGPVRCRQQCPYSTAAIAWSGCHWAGTITSSWSRSTGLSRRPSWEVCLESVLDQQPDALPEPAPGNQLRRSPAQQLVTASAHVVAAASLPLPAAEPVPTVPAYRTALALPDTRIRKALDREAKLSWGLQAGSATGNRTRICSLKDCRANRCTMAPVTPYSLR